MSNDAAGSIHVEDGLVRAGFTQVPNALLTLRDLSHGAKLTYAILLSYAWGTDSAFPGQGAIAADLGIGERQVRNYLNDLAEYGLIDVQQMGLGKPNRYVLPPIEGVLAKHGIAIPDRKNTAGQERKHRSKAPDRNHSAGLERKEISGPERNHSADKEDSGEKDSEEEYEGGVEARARPIEATTAPPAEILSACSVLRIPENTAEMPAILRATSKRPDLVGHFEHVADRTRLHYSGWGTLSEGRRVAAFIRFVETQRPPEILLVDGGGGGRKRGRAEPEPFVPGRGNDKYMDQFRRQAAEQRERAAQRKAEVASAAAG